MENEFTEFENCITEPASPEKGKTIIYMQGGELCIKGYTGKIVRLIPDA